MAFSDETAALRAFIARGETRLSTMQRTAGVFVGGAGILALLPSFFKDAVILECRALISSGPDAIESILLATIGSTILLPVVALYLLFRDLVLFFFTGHNMGSDHSGRFVPRFALSGLRVPTDEVSDETHEAIAQSRLDQVSLLVPDSKDRQEALWGTMNQVTQTRETFPAAEELRSERQRKLSEFLLDTTAAKARELVGEAAKMELSLSRHHYILRRLVLRYFKAVLLFVATVLASLFATVWISGDGNDIRVPQLICTYCVWAVAAALAVRSPIRWIYSYSRDRETKQHEFTIDKEMAEFETFSELLLLPFAVAALNIAAWMTDSVPAICFGVFAIIGVGLNGFTVIRGRRRTRVALR